MPISYIALSQFVSEQRLERYMGIASGDRNLVSSIYLENISKSKNLYPYLHWLEIGVRNAMNKALIGRYGPDWLEKPAEIGLKPYTIKKINEARTELAEDKKPIDNANIVAAMSFAFWVSLLDSSCEELWRRCLVNAFPHRPKDLSRRKIHGYMNEIRQLRNRIAHYEPIIHQSPDKKIENVLIIIHWISPVIAKELAL